MTTHRFHPRGAALQLLSERGPEVLIAGPAGTGKSRAALEKIHLMCLINGKCKKNCTIEHEHHARGMKALIVRQTLVSLTATGMVTFREHVAAEAISEGLVWFYGGSRTEAPGWKYSNGSSITLGGMDKPTKVMSSEYDIIFVQEATEITVTAWEKLNTRLRNGRISFQQLMADCNPEGPEHWLKKRCDVGTTKMLYGRHTDNPTLFDENGIPTEKGAAYLAKLNQLTGVRRLRLQGGIWAAAEGVIYESFDPEIHVSKRKSLPREWPRLWSIDFGFTNPFVWQQWARDPDGRIWLELEIYRTKRIVTDHVRQILETVTRGDGPIRLEDDGSFDYSEREWIYGKPEYVVCDHDAEDRETLRRAMGLVTRAARKDVSRGIEAFQKRLRIQDDGKPRLFVLENALVDRDQEHADSGHPLGLKEEMPQYVWKPQPETPSGQSQNAPDEPLKHNDHSADAGRYLVAEEDLRPRVRARSLG